MATHSSPTQTLAYVLGRVSEAPNLSGRQRNDLSSAVRGVARALGRPPAEILAHPIELRHRLDRFSPASASIQLRRWKNIRSLLRRALELADIPTLPGRSTLPLVPVWQGLYDRLPDRRHQYALTRFIHYCSDRGIVPEQVRNEVFDAFLVDLEQGSLVRRPRTVHRQATVAWNHAIQHLPGWPQQMATIPSYRKTYTLSWSDFPISLKADVDQWVARISGQNLLEEYDRRPVRPATVDIQKYLIRSFASALVRQGYDPGILRTLSELIQLPALKSGLRFFLDRNGGKSSARIFGIACMLKAIACHHVKVDAPTLNSLRAICKRLAPSHRGLTERNQRRLLPFDDPDFCARLVHLPVHLIGRASRQDNRHRSSALTAQLAVLIELLLVTGMRRGNLAGLDLDRHVIWSSGDRREIVRLFIPGAEVKNGRPLDLPLPRRTRQMLTTYLNKFRPRIVTCPSSWLFPGRNGRSKGACLIGQQVRRTIRAELGVEVHVHLFRHIGTKLLEHVRPGSLEIMRRVLGHSNLDTLLRYYADLQMAPAVALFDEHVLRLDDREARRHKVTGTRSRGDRQTRNMAEP